MYSLSYVNFIEDILKTLNTCTLFFTDLNHIKKTDIKEIFVRTTQSRAYFYNQNLIKWISFCICLFVPMIGCGCNVFIPMKAELIYSNEDTSQIIFHCLVTSTAQCQRQSLCFLSGKFYLACWGVIQQQVWDWVWFDLRFLSFIICHRSILKHLFARLQVICSLSKSLEVVGTNHEVLGKFLCLYQRHSSFCLFQV